MPSLLWLSHPLDPAAPRPPAIPAPELSWFLTVEKDGANVQMLRLANHTGTHLDSPRHVISDGAAIADFPPEELIYSRPVVIDLQAEDGEIVGPEKIEPHAGALAGADLALFRFGSEKFRMSEPGRFSTHCPGFGIPAGRWLREKFPRLHALGMDVPSVATIAHLDETMAVHHALLGGVGRKFIIIEEMHLAADLSGLREVRVSPWLVKGMDSGPCTILGVLA